MMCRNCGRGGAPVTPLGEECPNVAQHTKCPEGHLAWHAWAEQKSKRHKQVPCPTCGRWLIWIRRKPSGPDYGGEATL